MKYIDNEFLECKRINTLPFRSHFIPFGLNDVPRYFHGAIIKESSSEVISLNGKWKFQAYSKCQYFSGLEDQLKDTIDVPSCVQVKGYDHIQYLNVDYPFPFNPPYIDKDNPLFHYQRTFNVSNVKNLSIVFEGVDNSFYLFINGHKVGYSLIAHSKSEFDITPFVKEGNNTIDVLVLKWSSSSYFECQDKFRFSGIFRDVYLLNRPKEHITDYRIKTKINGNDGIICFKNQSKIDINVYFKNKKYISKPQEEIEIRIKSAKLWSSENPYLYKLKLTANGEVIYENVGIREVSTSNGVFKINNKHIKLKGVNRHETNPISGMTVTKEDTYKDLKLIKRMGANAIRTSHYPDIPEFYEMCDYLGIYVLDEADLETHGAQHYTNEYSNKTWQEFADRTEYSDAIYDREVSLFERDKNRTCVVIFSFGNEASFGKSYDKALTYLKETSDRPIHYEGVFNSLREEDYFDKRIDFASRMYASPEELIEKHLKSPKETRPIILCEYSHSMGNSNGDLLDYWKVINSSDRFAGGFIWEWCDHAILVNGKLHYGGDSNDLPNDNNFCVDGLVTPFREIKSNTLEMESIYKGKMAEDKKIDKTKEFVRNLNDNKVEIKLNEQSGGLKQVFVNGKQVFAGGLEMCFMRAKIDNDNDEYQSFKKIEEGSIRVEKIEKNNDFITVNGNLFNEKKLIEFELKYRIIRNQLFINLSYEILNDDLFVPRIGIRFAIKQKNTIFRYFGYGKGESYIDKHIHNEIGEFKLSSKGNMSNNLKPQECGSHYYSSYICLPKFDITADSPFSFSILPYSYEQLKNSKHNYDLISDGCTYVHLDVGMAGVGSHSCGPRLDKKYWLKKKDQKEFVIIFK